MKSARLALIGRLQNINAHSCVEVLAASAGFGQPFIAGQNMYTDNDPLKEPTLALRRPPALRSPRSVRRVSRSEPPSIGPRSWGHTSSRRRTPTRGSTHPRLHVDAPVSGAGSPRRSARLAEAVGSRGADASLQVRQAVALFFVFHLDAPGFEQVLDAWRADPARYDDHPAAFGPDPQLMFNLLEAIAVRVGRHVSSAGAALETWRWAALRGTGLGQYLHRAKRIDAQWTAEHVEQFLALAPAEREAVAMIRAPFPLGLIPGLRRAIALGHATRETVAATLVREYGSNADVAVAAL